MTTPSGWKFNRTVLEKESSFEYLTATMSTIMRRPYLLFLAVLLFSLQGCAVYNSGVSFINQRYINTVAYFNTYYNAETAFADAEKDVLAAQALELGRPVPLVTEAPLSQNAKDKFNLAIEKASKLLTFYPTSKWVENALLMIGKSYFYLGDDLKSQRKFLELFAKFPDSDFRFEAEWLYGRSLLRQKRYSEGLQSLERLYQDAVDKKEKKVAGLASLSIGRYYHHNLDYDQAVTNYRRSVETSNDGAVNAETELQAGYCYVALGDTEKASQAFTAVDDFDPEYATSFAAKFENIKILISERQYDEALRRLEALLSNAKNLENFPKIQLEIGLLYVAQGKIPDAVSKLSFVDTTYAKTDESARAYHTLGKIYETIQVDYAKAALNYNKAKLEYPASLITADASKKSDALTKYFIIYSDLSRCDSLIALTKKNRLKRDSLLLAADTVRAADSALAILQKGNVVPDSSIDIQKMQARRDSIARADSLKRDANARLFATETQSMDSLRQIIVKDHFELAGIFFLELERQDSALYWYQQVIDEGKKTDFAPRALFTLAEVLKTGGKSGKEAADSIYAEVISRYPDSQYAQESRRMLGIPLLVVKKDSAEALYLHAEPYFETSHADSALPLLYKIVQEDQSSPYCPKALYTIGWIYENKMNKVDSASAVYRRLLAVYPASQFALAVKPKIQEEDNQRREVEKKAAAEAAQKKKKEEADKKNASAPKDAKPAPNPAKFQP